MSSMTFGLTLLLVGMGGTLATLWLLTLLIRLMTALLPPPPRTPAVAKGETGAHTP